MSRIAHMLAAWRPRQEAWLAVARGLVAGDGPGIRALGSAISAPPACVVAGAALASIASSDGVDAPWTRITAQSFIPVDAPDIDSNQLHVRPAALRQPPLWATTPDGFTPPSTQHRKGIASPARHHTPPPHPHHPHNKNPKDH